MRKLKVVKTKRDYEEALAAIESLWDARPGSSEHDALEVLSILVERYEEEVFPMADPDPVEAIRFRLEQTGKESKDLIPVLGSRVRVSEVLRRKRRLSLAMIRRLHDELHIPFESLIPSASH
jgi:HTH-type transcriptional regulator/antitoxin HigA